MTYSKILSAISFLLIIFIAGCSRLQTDLVYPTKAELVANSYQNGLTTEIDLDYAVAYQNLRQAYTRCIAFTHGEEMVFTDNALTPDLEMGILTARTGDGHYLYQMNVEKLRNQKTQLTLFLPHNYKMAEKRFEIDIQRALGKDEQCNR